MNWSRRELKRKGRRNIYSNYWRIVGVLIIVSFIASGFKFDIRIGQEITDVKMAIDHSMVPQKIEISSRWAHKSSAEILNEMVKENEDSNMYKTMGNLYKPTNGVLAAFYNKIIGAESFLMGVLNGTNQIVFRERIGPGIIIMIGALLMLLLWIFVATPIIVGKSRYLLETRSYDDTHIGRITFPWRVKRVRRIALIMTLKQMFWVLWCFTIVGGFVKNYSYKMIPYILAENPDIDRKGAFALSKQMMNGQKWEAFKLDLSFFGWDLLNMVTFGILGWLYLKPYKETTCVELYLALREEAKAKATENNRVLFDDYLGTEPIDGVYPWEKYYMSEKSDRNWIKLSYKRHYSKISLVLLFFTFSIMGWVWEVIIHLVEDGEFVNRGTMFGPWLPIYGTGGVMIILLLKRFAEKPLLTFLLAVGACGALEYVTGAFLWVTRGARWWDYSGYFLNIQGIVCAEGLIIFGIGGMAFLYVLAPFFDDLYSRVSKKIKITICVILLILFGCDLIYSTIHPNMGKGITEYAENSRIDIVEVEDKCIGSFSSRNM